MRYVVALFVAGFIISGGILYGVWARWAFERDLRQSLRQQQQAGKLPPELRAVDFETADLSQKLGDFQMSLPRKQEQRLKISIFLSDFWYLWMPTVIAGCLVVAAVTGWRQRHQKDG
jgi:hypothetical protein